MRVNNLAVARSEIFGDLAAKVACNLESALALHANTMAMPFSLPRMIQMKLSDRDLSEEAFLRARSKALDGYGAIEGSLCTICAALLGTTPVLAGIVFFRITAARARNGAVEGLLKKRFGTVYNPFWNSIFKIMGSLDQRRNEIVHWRTAHNISHAGDHLSHEYALIPPNIWNLEASTPRITVANMCEFEAKCDFASRAMNMFHMVVLLDHQFDDRQKWLAIFQQEQVYPPPEDHPLFRKQ